MTISFRKFALLVAVICALGISARGADYFTWYSESGSFGGIWKGEHHVTMNFTVSPGGVPDGTYTVCLPGQWWGDGKVVVVSGGVITSGATWSIARATPSTPYYNDYATGPHVDNWFYTKIYNATTGGTEVKSGSWGHAISFDRKHAETPLGVQEVAIAVAISLGADAVAEEVVWKTKGNSWYPDTVFLTVKVVGTEAFNQIFTVPATALGATTGQSLVHSGTFTHPTPGYFTGKSITAFITGTGGEYDVASGTIPDRDPVEGREIEFNFGDAGKVIPPPATPTTPTADPTNTGNQSVPRPTPTPTPAPTTTPGKTGVSSGSTGNSDPRVIKTPETAVNNGSTTISGTGTGATVQDIYNGFKAALMDAGAGGTGAGGGSTGPGSGGGAAFADSDFEDPTGAVQGKVTQLVEKRGQVITGLTDKVAVNPMQGLPSTFGGGPGGFTLWSIHGTTATVDLHSSGAESIFDTMRACALLVLNITSAMGMVYTVRRYV